MKPRIHILGDPGSGESYAAANLTQQLNVPACDLDELFWDRATFSYGVHAEPEKREQRLAMIISQDGWIIEGVCYQWLAPGFEAADRIITLTPSVWIRHWRVIRRFILRRLGKIPSERESFGDICRLLIWSHAYDSNHLVHAAKSIAAHHRKMTVCKNFNKIIALARNLRTDSR